MQNSSQDKLSIGQASEFLSVSIDTLRRWEKSGKISALRSPGGHRYFLKADLENAFGQKYSRATLAKEELDKSTQLPQSAVPLPTQPSSIEVDQPTAAPVPPDYRPLPQEPTLESPSPLEEERTERLLVFEPTESPLLQTQEKRYMVEEIDATAQTPEPLTNQAITPTEPESYIPDISQSPTVPASEQKPTTQSQKFNEPLSSFDTHNSLLQSEVQPSQAVVPEVTVTPQQKKGSSLKKISLFLLIVFMMVNVILIGFYIFVSKQL